MEARRRWIPPVPSHLGDILQAAPMPPSEFASGGGRGEGQLFSFEAASNQRHSPNGRALRWVGLSWWWFLL
ncbi:unnamed protein product [Phytomonas sp. Hart1]|nr:unnamed protein product [Phytomonas sp. Hart1]|eukprot:CCW72321.1 unnamed protein product [Phytomonas sp. isolate Hart1]